MRLLAISASTQKASLALGTAGGSFTTLENLTPQTHSEFLNAGLERMLAMPGASLTELDAIAVDIGPGSFTGARAAVNLARTLGYALGKPLFPRTSLELLAHGLPSESVTAINAHKNLLFTRWADGRVELLSLADFSRKILDLGRPLTAVGDAFLQYAAHFPESVRALLLRVESRSDFPSAETFFSFSPKIAETFDWKSVRPLYVRASSAEEVLTEKLSKGNLDGTAGLGSRRG